MTADKCKKVLYLPSTPLNILVSLAHASQQKNQESVMMIIDQKDIADHPYLNALLTVENTPFKSVQVLAGQSLETSKSKLRKQNFTQLKALIEIHNFDAVATGSDRRIEFQYCMQQLLQNNKNVQGWYLDDGLYSYAGRVSKWYKDWAGCLVKKLAYGFWWDEPMQIGTSKWVTQSWLFDPCKAILQLKKNPIEKLESEWFKSPIMKDFGSNLFEFMQANRFLKPLQEASLFILLPHPHNVEKMPGYEKRLRTLIETAQSKHLNVVAKYHPRCGNEDVFKLNDYKNVSVVPSQIAFEAMLILLGSSVKVLGDVGTSLLTAKWLRPELAVFANLNQTNQFEREFSQLLTNHGVKVISSQSLDSQLGFEELLNE